MPQDRILTPLHAPSRDSIQNDRLPNYSVSHPSDPSRVSAT